MQLYTHIVAIFYILLYFIFEIPAQNTMPSPLAITINPTNFTSPGSLTALLIKETKNKYNITDFTASMVAVIDILNNIKDDVVGNLSVSLASYIQSMNYEHKLDRMGAKLKSTILLMAEDLKDIKYVRETLKATRDTLIGPKSAELNNILIELELIYKPNEVLAAINLIRQYPEGLTAKEVVSGIAEVALKLFNEEYKELVVFINKQLPDRLDLVPEIEISENLAKSPPKPDPKLTSNADVLRKYMIDHKVGLFSAFMIRLLDIFGETTFLKQFWREITKGVDEIWSELENDYTFDDFGPRFIKVTRKFINEFSDPTANATDVSDAFHAFKDNILNKDLAGDVKIILRQLDSVFSIGKLAAALDVLDDYKKYKYSAFRAFRKIIGLVLYPYFNMKEKNKRSVVLYNLDRVLAARNLGDIDDIHQAVENGLPSTDVPPELPPGVNPYGPTTDMTQ